MHTPTFLVVCAAIVGTAAGPLGLRTTQSTSNTLNANNTQAPKRDLTDYHRPGFTKPHRKHNKLGNYKLDQEEALERHCRHFNLDSGLLYDSQALLDKGFEAAKDKYWLCGKHVYPATSCYKLDEFGEIQIEEGTNVVKSPYGIEYCDPEERFVGPPYLFGGPPYLNDARDRERFEKEGPGPSWWARA